jgi:S1-C subfamily serine protease
VSRDESRRGAAPEPDQPAGATFERAADLDSDRAAEAAYMRPADVDDSFGPREPEQLYSPPPPTVSPEERAEFGRPAGSNDAFAPLPGERIPPAHRSVAPPVHPGLTREYGRPPGVGEFDPEPGTRISPQLHKAESPWWKADARRDPWRDPRSPFWLGRPAVFSGGRPAQVTPDEDSEQLDDEIVPMEETAEEELPSRVVRSARFGLSALLLTLIVALVAGGLGGATGYWFAIRAHSALHNSDIKLAQVDTPANRPPGSVAEISQRVSPAVVSIQEHTSDLDAVGAGVIVQKAGYILTNNHVISDAATNRGQIWVTFADKARLSAKVVGRDPKTDLAVIKVDRSKLTVAALGDSAKLAVGDPVIAIGSPLGLRGTVTTGIVSALGRPVPVSGEGSDTNAVIDAIQTDAAINPGNSGGALVDAAGAVIGINTAAVSPSVVQGGPNGSVGLGFAIPINSARVIAEELIHTGKAAHASIGLQARSSTDGLRDGAYVVQVNPEGPADQAGLKAGDVITLVDTTLIDSREQLAVTVQEHKPGDKVKVHFYRENSKKESATTVTLSSD